MTRLGMVFIGRLVLLGSAAWVLSANVGVMRADEASEQNDAQTPESGDNRRCFVEGMGPMWTPAKATYYMGKLARQGGDVDRAIRHFERFVEQNPESPFRDNALLSLARLHGRTDNARKVETLIRYLKEYSSSPDAAEAFLLLGRAHFARGDADAALACYDKLLSLHPSSDYCDDALWGAYQAAVRRNKRQATDRGNDQQKGRGPDWYFERLIQARPESAFVEKAYLAKARDEAALRQKGATSRRAALETLAEFRKECPSCPWLHADSLLLSSQICDKLGRDQDAIEWLRKLAEHFPRSHQAVEARYRVGEILDRAGDHAKAARVFAGLAHDVPACDLSDSALLRAGMMYARAGQRKDAMACWSRTVRYYPGSTSAREALQAARDAGARPSIDENTLGFAKDLFDDAQRLQREERPKEALAAYRTLLRRTGDTHHSFVDNALWECGLICQREGEHAPAIEYFDRLTERCPRSALAPEAKIRAAGSARELGNAAQAIGTYREVMALFPHSESVSQARWEIARTLERDGKHHDAAAAYDLIARKPALRDGPARALSEQAWCYSRSGDRARAERLFRRVFEEHPHHDLADNAMFESAQCLQAIHNAPRAPDVVARRHEFLRSYPASPHVESLSYELARSFLLAKRFLEAADAYTETARLYPFSDRIPTMHQQAADALVAAGQKDRALGHVKQAFAAAVSPVDAAIALTGVTWLAQGARSFRCASTSYIDVYMPPWYEGTATRDFAVGLDAAWRALEHLTGVTPDSGGKQVVEYNPFCGGGAHSGNPVEAGPAFWQTGSPWHMVNLIVHEVGHNFHSHVRHLNRLIQNNASDPYWHHFCTILNMSIFEMLLRDPARYGLPAEMLDSLRSWHEPNRGKVLAALSNYERFVAQGGDPAQFGDTYDAAVGMWLALGNEYGWDIYPKFFRGIAQLDEEAFAATNTTDRQNALIVQTVEHAAGVSLLERFAATWGFPVDRSHYRRLNTESER